ncbi:hypothetical protein TWF281_009775 [Arthrobotrys megalospora]
MYANELVKHNLSSRKDGGRSALSVVAVEYAKAKDWRLAEMIAESSQSRIYHVAYTKNAFDEWVHALTPVDREQLAQVYPSSSILNIDERDQPWDL